MLLETVILNRDEQVTVRSWFDRKAGRWTASIADNGEVYAEGATKETAKRALLKRDLSAYAEPIEDEDTEADFWMQAEAEVQSRWIYR